MNKIKCFNCKLELDEILFIKNDVKYKYCVDCRKQYGKYIAKSCNKLKKLIKDTRIN